MCRVALQAKREERLVDHELREAARLFVQAVTDKVADWLGPRASQETWTRTYHTPSSLLVRTQSSSQPPECVEWSGLRSDTKREVKGGRQSGRFGESSGRIYCRSHTLNLMHQLYCILDKANIIVLCMELRPSMLS